MDTILCASTKHRSSVTGKSAIKRWNNTCATSMTTFRGILSYLFFLFCCLRGNAHFEDCTSSEDLGDGICDHQYNYEACSYDGGDCCDCTSKADDDFTGYLQRPKLRMC